MAPRPRVAPCYWAGGGLGRFAASGSHLGAPARVPPCARECGPRTCVHATSFLHLHKCIRQLLQRWCDPGSQQPGRVTPNRPQHGANRARRALLAKVFNPPAHQPATHPSAYLPGGGGGGQIPHLREGFLTTATAFGWRPGARLVASLVGFCFAGAGQLALNLRRRLFPLRHVWKNKHCFYCRTSASWSPGKGSLQQSTTHAQCNGSHRPPTLPASKTARKRIEARAAQTAAGGA